MPSLTSRRSFLQKTSLAAAGGAAGLGELAFLSKLRPVAAAETRLDPEMVRLESGIEPLVRLIETTPRHKLLEEVGARVTSGKLSYQELLAALQLAGVRNIQPRPVGFKFHAVLVVNSAHLASIASPDRDRWLPIFWALDYFKHSQLEDEHQGDWTMAPVDESTVPPPHQAERAFRRAMDGWDETAADAAVAGLTRAAGSHRIFELFARYGSRDFRDIGHKAIFVANSWRTLQNIGWQHAEPILRSLAYALQAHAGGNPAKDDVLADRPWRENSVRVEEIPANWQDGAPDPGAAAELLPLLRESSHSEASQKVVELLQRNVSPQSLWNVLLEFSGELLMRRSDILSLHAVTASNAMFYAYRTVSSDDTRRMLLLQNAAFQTLFRRDPGEIARKPHYIDQLEPVDTAAGTDAALEEIFADISGNRLDAASKVLAFCEKDPRHAAKFMDAARRLLFLKGDNSHDYKFTSAVLEDFSHLSPGSRERYLAASVFNLRGSGDPDSPLVARTRSALS